MNVILVTSCTYRADVIAFRRVALYDAAGISEFFLNVVNAQR